MQDIDDRLRRLEDRLERLLASGWRHAVAEAAELTGEADALAALGLEHLAARLRAVATATSAAEALSAVALAAAACRLLRARLPVDALPPGDWAPLAAPDGPPPTPERLLLVARVALAGGEAWACVRRQGGTVTDWMLVEPPGPPPEPPPDPVPEPPPPTAPSSLLGKLRFRLGGSVGKQAGDAAPRPGSPWLRTPIQGHLRWLARYPVGTAGEVQHCRLEAHRWTPPGYGSSDTLTRWLQAATTGQLADDQPVLGPYGPLRVKALTVDDARHYDWLDPAAEAAFRAVAKGQVWALSWLRDGLLVPLAIVVPGAHRRPAQLVHLVPGCPADPLLR
jgi:hypothetical protein